MRHLSKEKTNRLDELMTLLSNPPAELYQSSSKMKSLNNELLHLQKLKALYDRQQVLEDSLKSNLDLIANETDTELKSMLETETDEFKQEFQNNEADLLELETPKDPHDYGDCICEIRAGTGGEEAALFAQDLFRMYSKFAEKNKFKIDIIDQTFASSGGFKEIIFNITGDNAYGMFKRESGVHRVQRIPQTETAGRIHTSAASVVILPIIEAGEVNIDEKDLRVDVYRSSGAGGQGVNTTDSAVRITHIPTNIVVTCQDSRSQIKNKAAALNVLRSKLYELELTKKEGNITDIRKAAIRTGDRSDKIKTYNYPQNRVTDHRAKVSWYKLDQIMEGDIDEVLNVKFDSNAEIDDTEE